MSGGGSFQGGLLPTQADVDDDDYDDVSGDENLSVNASQDDVADDVDDDYDADDLASDVDDDGYTNTANTINPLEQIKCIQPDLSMVYKAHATSRRLKDILARAASGQGSQVAVKNLILTCCASLSELLDYSFTIDPAMARDVFSVHERVANYKREIRAGNIEKVHVTGVMLKKFATDASVPLLLTLKGLPGKITPLIRNYPQLSGRGAKVHYLAIGSAEYKQPVDIFTQKKFTVMHKSLHNLNLELLKADIHELPAVKYTSKNTIDPPKEYRSYAMREGHPVLKMLRANSNKWNIDPQLFRVSNGWATAPKEMVDHVMCYLDNIVQQYKTDNLLNFGIRLQCAAPGALDGLMAAELNIKHYIAVELQVHYIFLDKESLVPSKPQANGRGRY